jgi:hypothetical protein
LDFGLLLLIVFILAPLLEKLLGGRGQQPPEQGPPGRKPGQPLPGQRLPGQQPPPMPRGEREIEEVPFRSVPAGHTEEDEAAAGMLPDDLWEILTGEKRPPARSGPRQDAEAAPPVPVPAPPPRQPDAAQRRDEQFRLEQQRDAQRREEQRRAAERERERIRNRPAGAPRDRRPSPVEVRGRTVRETEPVRRPAGPPPGDADRLVRPVPVRAAPAVASYRTAADGEARHARFQARLEQDAADAAAAAPPPRVELFADVESLRRAIIVSEVLGRPRGLE